MKLIVPGAQQRHHVLRLAPAPRVPTYPRLMSFAVGQAVELYGLDELKYNGRKGYVASALVDGRYKVLLSDQKSVNIKPVNLRLPSEGDAPLVVPIYNNPASATSFNQSSRSSSYNKTISYVVNRDDFQALPRWPGDGLERMFAAFKDPTNPFHGEHHEFDKTCNTQRAFVRVFGGWPCGKRLREMDKQTQAFVLSLPYQRQAEASQETFDSEAAMGYLYRHRRESCVREVLKFILGNPRGSLGSDRSRFPSLRRMLGALAGKSKATDENLEILFGDAAHVRAMMLEVGSLLADPPPPGSPSYRDWADVIEAHRLGSPLGKLPRACSECGQAESSTISVSVCAACKTVMYCGATCQKKHWPIHRPDCFGEQGKTVTPAHFASAEAASVVRAQELASRPEVVAASEKQAALQRERVKVIVMDMQAYVEGTWKPSRRVDCKGKQFVEDVGISGLSSAKAVASSVEAVEADRVEELYVGYPLVGIDRTTMDEGEVVALWLFKGKNGAYVLFTTAKLYSGADSPEAHHSYALTGAYVARWAEGSTSRTAGRPVSWTEIPRPDPTEEINTPYKLFRSWLSTAVSSATVVTHGLYSEGTPLKLGHSTVEHEIEGILMRVVGPASD